MASKVVLLAGGLGTRFAEETADRPKPMIEVGGRPILWHIMKIYSHYGLNDFIVCLGYKGYYIKEYFANYFLHMADVCIDLENNSTQVLQNRAEKWKITLIDTGAETMTGGRVKRVRDYIGDEDFCLTYGDGVGDVDIAALREFHRKSGRLATLTGVRPPGRFGALSLEYDHVQEFVEKPLGDGSWVNGGFFVCSPKVIDYVDGDETIWEKEPLQNLAAEGQLGAYKHEGFWQPMDTLRDKKHLEELWAEGRAPWKVW